MYKILVVYGKLELIFIIRDKEGLLLKGNI